MHQPSPTPPLAHWLEMQSRPSKQMPPISVLQPEASFRQVLSLVLSLRQQILLAQSPSVSQDLVGSGSGASDGLSEHTQTAMSSALSLEEQVVLGKLQSAPLQAFRHNEPTQKVSSGQSAEREQLDVQKPSVVGACCERKQTPSAQSSAVRHLLPNTQASLEQ